MSILNICSKNVYYVPIVVISLLTACTEQQEFKVTNPFDQTIQAGRNLLNTGSWRPLPTSSRARTYSYIASEGFMIPSGYVETSRLNKELQDFIQAYNIDSSDTILLDGLRNKTGATTDDSENAISRIKLSLQEIGFKSKKSSTPIAILDSNQHNAAVMIHRKMIVSPDCEIPPHPTGTRPSRQMFGCVQEVNLANMVVSPDALDGTRAMSSADSTAVTLGIDRYRTGKVTPLDTTGVTSSSSE
ncbi:CpaD family pilus assembly lipoprotein [Kiloniella antarctica]|uniref:CpaD family pilus assembly lipoprotein n=1 Tax=Kiloniella antarctica TaxID=1550907 RepID=A0ABW5BQQ9_9PROT